MGLANISICTGGGGHATAGANATERRGSGHTRRAGGGAKIAAANANVCGGPDRARNRGSAVAAPASSGVCASAVVAGPPADEAVLDDTGAGPPADGAGPDDAVAGPPTDETGPHADDHARDCGQVDACAHPSANKGAQASANVTAARSTYAHACASASATAHTRCLYHLGVGSAEAAPSEHPRTTSPRFLPRESQIKPQPSSEPFSRPATGPGAASFSAP